MVSNSDATSDKKATFSWVVRDDVGDVANAVLGMVPCCDGIIVTGEAAPNPRGMLPWASTVGDDVGDVANPANHVSVDILTSTVGDDVGDDVGAVANPAIYVSVDIFIGAGRNHPDAGAARSLAVDIPLPSAPVPVPGRNA
jgi:hypothetical protein